jgi:hypothetical protein
MARYNIFNYSMSPSFYYRYVLSVPKNQLMQKEISGCMGNPNVT